MFINVTSKIQKYKIKLKTMKSRIQIAVYNTAQKQFSYVKCHIKTQNVRNSHSKTTKNTPKFHVVKLKSN